jgi:hypothetical protein
MLNLMEREIQMIRTMLFLLVLMALVLDSTPAAKARTTILYVTDGVSQPNATGTTTEDPLTPAAAITKLEGVGGCYRFVGTDGPLYPVAKKTTSANTGVPLPTPVLYTLLGVLAVVSNIGSAPRLRFWSAVHD